MTEADQIKFKDFIFDPDNFLVIVKGKPIHLTNREVRLLLYLIENKTQTLTTKALSTHIFEFHKNAHTAIVKQYIHYLRRKIGEHHIETRARIGYKFIE